MGKYIRCLWEEVQISDAVADSLVEVRLLESRSAFAAETPRIFDDGIIETL